MMSKMDWVNVKRVPLENVGRRHEDEWAGTAIEVAERRAVEQDLVVQLRRQLGTTPSGGRELRPVRRAERPGDDVALNVALQESLLVVDEQLVPVKPVRERREAAAGDPGDDVDFVEQPYAVALRSDDLGPLQKFENAIRERGCPRAAAGKREHNEVLLVLRVNLPRFKAITAAGIRLRDRGIDGATRTTSERDGQQRQGQDARQVHRAYLTVWGEHITNGRHGMRARSRRSNLPCRRACRERQPDRALPTAH